MSQQTTNRSFDDLARALAEGSISRRRALKLFAGSALAALIPSRALAQQQKVTICHKPGTPAEKTMEDPRARLMATCATATTWARVKQPILLQRLLRPRRARRAQPRRAQPRRALRRVAQRALLRRALRRRLPQLRLRRAQPRLRRRRLCAYRMAAPPATPTVSAAAVSAIRD